MIWLYASLIALAPLYIWRFELVGLPTNFFMVYAGGSAILGAAVLLKNKQLGDFWMSLKALPAIIRWAAVGLLAAATISLFVGGADAAKTAQWLVLYVLPLALSAQLYFFLKEQPDRKRTVLWFIYIFLGATGVLAVAQYFWLLGLPSDWWGNANEPKRAIGFFIHPNNLALFIAPLLAYTLPNIKEQFENWWNGAGKIFSKELAIAAAWILGAIALLLSLSRGGWLGLLAAGGLFVILAGGKKIRLMALGLLIVIGLTVAVVPNLRYRVILPFYGEKSSVARLSLWDTGMKMIKDSPVLGQGINGFNYNWDKFNTDPNLDHYNFPHNFILNTWIDLGLLGLVSWLVIAGYGIWYGFHNRAQPFALGLLLFMSALLVHGLIDIPYFKNDLAMIFWLVLALSL